VITFGSSVGSSVAGSSVEVTYSVSSVIQLVEEGLSVTTNVFVVLGISVVVMV